MTIRVHMITRNEKHSSGNQLDYFKRDFGFDYVFYPNFLLFIIRF